MKDLEEPALQLNTCQISSSRLTAQFLMRMDQGGAGNVIFNDN
jgi:hypothetical protein